MSHRTASFVLAASLGLLVGLAAIPQTAHSAPSARSELYSVRATDRFCSRAQQIISSVPFGSNNVVHTNFTAFANSSSAPYEGPNLGSYGGTLALYPYGNNMPLTTQQYVSHRELGTTRWEYPIVISCKMKTAEAINFHIGDGTAGPQKTCKEVNQQTVADVYASLTSIEQRTLRWPQSDIIFLDDIYSASGPSWLYPLPDYLPAVARVDVNGKLRIRGFAITVARTDPSTAASADKKGSYYCHLPSPEYVRAIVTGQANPILESPPQD